MEDKKGQKEELKEEQDSEPNLEEEVLEDQKKVEELERKLSECEAQKEEFREELNKQFLDLVQRKSQEASELIKKKEEELERKYSLKLEEERKFLYEKELTELVNIFSRLEEVVNSESKSAEVKNYLLGFRMILNQFEVLFEDLNIKTISPLISEEFDSESMESVETEMVTTLEQKNRILKVFSKGYKLHERVIKLAQVKVGI